MFAEPDSPVKGKVQEVRRQVSVPHPDFKNRQEPDLVSWPRRTFFLRDVFLGEPNWTVQFTGKMFPFYSLVHNDINGQLLFCVPFIPTLSLTPSEHITLRILSSHSKPDSPVQKMII
jgi:hypothetical protein